MIVIIKLRLIDGYIYVLLAASYIVLFAFHYTHGKKAGQVL